MVGTRTTPLSSHHAHICDTCCAVLCRALTHRYGSITAPVTIGGHPHHGGPEPPPLLPAGRPRRTGRKALVREGAPCLASVHRRSSTGPAPSARPRSVPDSATSPPSPTS